MLISLHPNRTGQMLSGMMVALGVSGLLLASAAVTYMLGLRSFALFRDTIDMDSQGRRASELLGQDIRGALGIVRYADDALVLAVGTNEVAIRYRNRSRTLVRQSVEGSRVLLNDCDEVSYEFFSRARTNDAFGLLPSSSPTNANAVLVHWKCSRRVAANSTNVVVRQTPRFTMRKSLL